MNDESIKLANHYCTLSYRETLKMQLFLSSEGNVSMSYTDKISLSELKYLIDILGELNDERNKLNS